LLRAVDGRRMTPAQRPTHVLVAGGGIAGLELVLALRVLAGQRVTITVLTPAARLTPPAMTVAEPFARGGAPTYDWPQIAGDQGVHLVLDSLAAVDTAERAVYTHSGKRMSYDLLAIVTGARRAAPFAGAVTFGVDEDASDALRRITADLVAGTAASVAFALPTPSTWPLPLYELALLTAHELRERGCDAPVKIVTPEQTPLALFGAAANDAFASLLKALAVDAITGARPRGVRAGALLLSDGQVDADRVVTIGDVRAKPVAGLPVDRVGFIPVDLHGRVPGEPAVYAAGEATSFPLRQGGLATQQADAVAEAIAAACGAGNEPSPFRPILRGRLLTSGAPLYLQARPSGQSLASTRALWSPPEKVAGRYLAPYLATARPSRLGAAALTELVPAVAELADDACDAVTLALSVAAAEARHGDPARSKAAFEAARRLGAPPRLPIEPALEGSRR
jgi:sulfide:quinone oxidoreductase